MVDIISSFVDKISRIRHNAKSSGDLLPWSQNENIKDFYGVTAPLECFMKISKEELYSQFWDLVEEGDTVIGRIISKTCDGLNVAIICFDADKSFCAENLKITAFCQKSSMPLVNNHDDPLSRYKDGDLVRGDVLLVDRKKHDISISFSKRHKKFDLEYGQITDEDLPVSYKRTLSNESYDRMLSMTTGFYNPNVIVYLSKRLISNPKKSFVTELDNLHYGEKDCASGLRKCQSSRIAKRCVKMGIDFFHNGQTIEALQELNRALDLDPSNIDALVARGAIFANKSASLKAIADFEFAIKLDPKNKNAKKYLIEVLLNRAKSIQEDLNDLEKIIEVEKLYSKVLAMDPACQEANHGLVRLKKCDAYSKLKYASSDYSSTPNSSPNDGHTATINKVKRLLEKEKHLITPHKKRRGNNLKTKKRSKQKSYTSSSSGTTSTESSDSNNESTTSSQSSTSSSSSSTKRRLIKKDYKKQGTSTLKDKIINNSHVSKSGRSRSRPDSPLTGHLIKNSRSPKKRSSTSKDSSSRRKSYPVDADHVITKRRSLSTSEAGSSQNRKTLRAHMSALSSNLHKQGNQKPCVITKVDKSTFGSILDQISSFEKHNSKKN